MEHLKSFNQFIVYKTAPKNDGSGKLAKVPCDLRGNPHDAQDPAIWLTYESAMSQAATLGAGYSIGFSITQETKLGCIDIDSCLQANNEWNPLAIELCTMFSGALVERSISNKGLHIWFSYTGIMPLHACKNTALGIEFYHESRFIALGTPYHGSAAFDATLLMTPLINKYFPAQAEVVKPINNTPVESDTDLRQRFLTRKSTGALFGSELCNMTLFHATPETLVKYYHHADSPNVLDSSSADMSLASRLAQFTTDADQIERLMRQSQLVRDKWDNHKTYLSRTIERALNTVEPMLALKHPQAMPHASGLSAFSLRGKAKTMETKMLSDKFIMKPIALMGQFTVLYAKPNTGKTLLTLHMIIQAIKGGDVDGNNVFYVNADDTYPGLIHKLKIAERYGFHMLAPGHEGFSNNALLDVMRQMVKDNAAQGQVIVLDTLKKFTDLMDKKVASTFMQVMREFISIGGTVVGLAHTNKNRDVGGKLVFAGTSDVVDDCDCAYIIDQSADDGVISKTAVFENIKMRGNVARRCGFRYDTLPNTSYSELLASIRQLDESGLETLNVGRDAANDASIVQEITDCLKAYNALTKTELIKNVRDATALPRRKIIEAIDKNEGKHWEVFHDGYGNTKFYRAKLVNSGGGCNLVNLVNSN